MAAGLGDDEDHARVSPRLFQREQGGLTDRVVLGVDAQERAPHVRQVAAARAVPVVMLQVGQSLWRGYLSYWLPLRLTTRALERPERCSQQAGGSKHGISYVLTARTIYCDSVQVRKSMCVGGGGEGKLRQPRGG